MRDSGQRKLTYSSQNHCTSTLRSGRRKTIVSQTMCAPAERLSQSEIVLPLRKTCYYSPLAEVGATKGICYDLASLFAAMCRSQGVPCKLTNGYVGNVYHAWDQVYVNGAWQNIDPTYAVARVRNGAADFQGCISPRTLVAVASV